MRRCVTFSDLAKIDESLERIEKEFTPRRLSFSDISPTPTPSPTQNTEYELLPQTPVNSSEESDSDSTSISSSEISDISVNSLTRLLEEGEINRKTIEDQTKLHYKENLERFTFTLTQICRQLRMLNYAYAHHKKADTIEDSDAGDFDKRLCQIKAMSRTIDRRSAGNKPHFSLLFELVRFLENCPSYYLIGNSEMTESICDLINSWILNPSFQVTNYDKLVFFLREFYEDQAIKKLGSHQSPLHVIFRYWLESYYFDQDIFHEKIVTKTDYLGAFYFEILCQKFEEKMDEAFYPIPGLLDLASEDLSFFHNFLTKFNIPFSGPYKDCDMSNQKIMYFVSSVNPTDSAANNSVPLYGSYRFDLSSLSHLNSEQAIKIWERLDKIPFWLSYFPPLFNFALEGIREQIAATSL